MMDLNGLLRELAKVRNVADPADRRWSWAASYLGRALDLPRVEGARRIRAMAFSEQVGEDALRERLTGVSCAVLVATSLPTAAAATAEVMTFIADPAVSLSGAIILLRDGPGAPRLVNAVAVADGPLTNALDAFLGPAGLTVVAAARVENDDTEESKLAAVPATFLVDGHAWLIAVDDSYLTGDLVGLELRPDRGRRRPSKVAIEGWLALKGRPSKIAAGDWLALTGIGGTVVPEVSHVVRVAAVNQGPSLTGVVFDRVQLVPEHTRAMLPHLAAANIEGGHVSPIRLEDIVRLLMASGVHDPDGLAASLSRLTPNAVRGFALQLRLPYCTLLACTSSLAAGRNLIVHGPTGTGKTALVRALADAALQIGLLTSPALSIGKDIDKSGGGYPPSPFDYRTPSYDSSDYAPPSSRTRLGLRQGRLAGGEVTVPGAVQPVPPVAAPPWALVDDLTLEHAAERCERALTAVDTNGRGRVLVTTCLTPDELAVHLGPALLRRFAVVQIEALQSPEDWGWLIDRHGSNLDAASRDRLLELALSGDVSPAALIDLTRQIGCLLVTGVSTNEAMAVALSAR